MTDQELDRIKQRLTDLRDKFEYMASVSQHLDRQQYLLGRAKGITTALLMLNGVDV